MRISDWSSDVCASDLPVCDEGQAGSTMVGQSNADTSTASAGSTASAQAAKASSAATHSGGVLGSIATQARPAFQQPSIATGTASDRGSNNETGPSIRKSKRLNSSHKCETRKTSYD